MNKASEHSHSLRWSFVLILEAGKGGEMGREVNMGILFLGWKFGVYLAECLKSGQGSWEALGNLY